MQEEEAAKAKAAEQAKAKVVEDDVLELSEDGSFDTAAATAAAASTASGFSYAKAAAAAKDLPSPPVTSTSAPAATKASTEAADEVEDQSEPMDISNAKGIDFPETEEERERKLREEEEDKTPARKFKVCLLVSLALYMSSIYAGPNKSCVATSHSFTASLNLPLTLSNFISTHAQPSATAVAPTSTCGSSS